MAIGLRVEDRLSVAENFGPWKERIILLLEEFKLWDIVEKAVQPPTNLIQLLDFNKHNVKAKRILLDVIKDHLIPNVPGKKFAYEMWDSLIKFY